MVTVPEGVPLPWEEQLQFVKGIVSQATTYDKGGIDIWPIFTSSALEKIGNPEIECLLNVTDPAKAINYVQGYKLKLRTTPTRKLFSRLVEKGVTEAIENPASTKGPLFLISTDGKPDEDGPTMQETTNQGIMALNRAGLDTTRYI